MNRLKNIGISALAGTLVSLSAAQAGGVSVTGNWELSYTNKNSSKVTGNKLGINKNITFGASGDVSDGGGVTWASTVAMSDSMGLSSASMNINMGGIATLAYDSGTGGYGANAVDNIVPTAWEEIDYGLSTGITDLGMVSSSKGVINLTVKSPGSGTGISLSYVPRIGGGHIADGATSGEVTGGRGYDAVVDLVNVSQAHFGMRLGFAAEYEVVTNSCNEPNQHTCNVARKNNPYGGSSFFTMKLGPVSFGTQATFKDPQESASTGIANKRAIVAGAALNFGNLSFSYGQGWDKYRYNDACRGGDAGGPGGGEAKPKCSGLNLDGTGGEYENIYYHGWSAAINVGPAALKATRNHVGGWGENSSNSGYGLQKSHSEINLSLAF